MGAVFQISARLESTGPCPTCGIEFAMPEHPVAQRRLDKRSFYCPNGHTQSYTKSELETLRAKLTAQEQATAKEKQRREWAEQNVEREKRSNAALRGEMTKVKNRVGNGVCPCCTRSFTNLRLHMTTKHPGYKQEGAT